MAKLDSSLLELQSNAHRVSKWATYGLSPHAPSAESYSPPGTGCSRVSNVVGFCIRFTDSALISAEDRKPKSTLPIVEATG